MGISDTVLEVVADILLDQRDEASSTALQSFEDFVFALSIDSGLSEREAQSRLVEKMLQNPRYEAMTDNVIWMDDYKSLLQVN